MDGVFFNTRLHEKLTEAEPEATASVPPLRVGTIYENGPAWKNGLRLGDEVLEIGDTIQVHGEVAHGPVALLDMPVRFMSVKVYASPE